MRPVLVLLPFWCCGVHPLSVVDEGTQCCGVGAQPLRGGVEITLGFGALVTSERTSWGQYLLSKNSFVRKRWGSGVFKDYRNQGSKLKVGA